METQRKFSARELRTAEALIDGKTQRQIAKDFGVSQSAVSQRLARFESKLAPDALERFRRAARRSYGAKKPVQLSLVKGGV